VLDRVFTADNWCISTGGVSSRISCSGSPEDSTLTTTSCFGENCGGSCTTVSVGGYSKNSTFKVGLHLLCKKRLTVPLSRVHDQSGDLLRFERCPKRGRVSFLRRLCFSHYSVAVKERLLSNKNQMIVAAKSFRCRWWAFLTAREGFCCQDDFLISELIKIANLIEFTPSCHFIRLPSVYSVSHSPCLKHHLYA
jgi:hypothetical protein